MVHVNKYIVFIVTSIWYIAACDDTSQRGIDSQEVKQEIRNREIKYVTQPQIIDAAFKRGSQITDTLQQALTRQMQKAVAEKSLTEAAAYCKLEQLEAYKQLQEKHTASIKRVRLKAPKADLLLNEMEKQLLDAYQYNQENKLPLENNVQKSGAEEMLFTAPILVSNTVCLKCHGKVGTDLSGEEYQTLQATYRMDSLVNYSLNQPIAIWSILFPRKGLIKSIQAE
ncbi:DUF3365 domain-containing protein [Rhodocytophaga aerolata]|uniref:DUF3365 domain-containing protein n=1 Tax=Rhodocytophaga aerolata TaxID=455078 RepID=A0ABT8R0Y0_9BACT|nr:DUF3365 domain-containing protein [Rhodocytophaga aerolata]MDO1445746.1 DUF3365 domain-containing protein [Rhodocytophaga aerolata]